MIGFKAGYININASAITTHRNSVCAQAGGIKVTNHLNTLRTSSASTTHIDREFFNRCRFSDDCKVSGRQGCNCGKITGTPKNHDLGSVSDGRKTCRRQVSTV